MVKARFFGGEADGRAFSIDESLLEGYRVPVPHQVGFTDLLTEGDVMHPMELKADLYRWDITINEAGEYRMRWRP